MFTTEELSHLTSLKICRFLVTKKVYGREDAGVDDNPTEGRSTTLHYSKKAIPYFTPNKLMKWTIIGVGGARGNPTKSQEVTKHEFFQALILIGRNENLIGQLRCLAMIKFQLHLICRNDDTVHVTNKDTLKRSPQFP